MLRFSANRRQAAHHFDADDLLIDPSDAPRARIEGISNEQLSGACETAAIRADRRSWAASKRSVSPLAIKGLFPGAEVVAVRPAEM